MSNSDIKRMTLPIREGYYSVFATKQSRVNRYNVVMTSLTKDEEKAIDNGHSIKITRGNQTFDISDKNIYFYGELDFNSDSEDMCELSEEKWFDNYEDHGFWLPGQYDYVTHTAIVRGKKPTYYDTINVAKVLQYIHGILGKPKITVVFKNTYK